MHHWVRDHPILENHMDEWLKPICQTKPSRKEARTTISRGRDGVNTARAFSVFYHDLEPNIRSEIISLIIGARVRNKTCRRSLRVLDGPRSSRRRAHCRTLGPKTQSTVGEPKCLLHKLTPICTPLNAQRNLSKNSIGLATAVERLSSGLRVNGAKDDAANLAIALGMDKSARGISASIRTASDIISQAQTADGALAVVGDILLRMSELAAQCRAPRSPTRSVAISTRNIGCAQYLDRDGPR